MFRLKGQSFMEVNKGWDFNEEVDQRVKIRWNLETKRKQKKKKLLEWDEIKWNGTYGRKEKGMGVGRLVRQKGKARPRIYHSQLLLGIKSKRTSNKTWATCRQSGVDVKWDEIDWRAISLWCYHFIF